MSRPVRAVSYRAVLRSPGAPRAFASATLGRLSYGIVTLALLFTAQEATGSFAVAGTAVGLWGLLSLTAPAKARLVDRYGQPRVLTLLGTAYAATLAAYALVDNAVALVALAVAAGALAPPLGPAMRALWSALSPDPETRQRAFSLDAVVEDVLFTVGPVLAGGLIAVGGPRLALWVTAALALVGSVLLATSPAARALAAGSQTTTRGSLGAPAFRSLLVVPLVVGVSLGAADVGVAARASAAGLPEAAGYLLAGLSLGSAIGGLVWGQRGRGRPFARLLAALGLGLAVAVAAPNLVVLGVVLGLTGAAVTPLLIVAYEAADDLAPQSGRTEATTWVNTAFNVGAATGAAAAGLVADRVGEPLLLAVGVLVLGVLVVRRWPPR
jgi:MFS family permease